MNGAVHLDGLGHDAGEPVPAHAGYEGPPPAGGAGGGEGRGGGAQAGLGVGALPDDPGPGHCQGGVRHAGAGEERSVTGLTITHFSLYSKDYEIVGYEETNYPESVWE